MRKKKTVHAPTPKEIKAQRRKKDIDDLIVKMPYIATTTLSCSVQCSEVLATINTLAETNDVLITDKIERCRRNAESTKMLCSIIEDNIQYMQEELLYVQRLLNMEIPFGYESTHNNTAE